VYIPQAMLTLEGPLSLQGRNEILRSYVRAEGFS